MTQRCTRGHNYSGSNCPACDVIEAAEEQRRKHERFQADQASKRREHEAALRAEDEQRRREEREELARVDSRNREEQERLVAMQAERDAERDAAARERHDVMVYELGLQRDAIEESGAQADHRATGRTAAVAKAREALAMVEVGDVREAVHQAQIAIRLWPTYPWAHFALSRAKAAVREDEAAASALRRAAELLPRREYVFGVPGDPGYGALLAELEKLDWRLAEGAVAASKNEEGARRFATRHPGGRLAAELLAADTQALKRLEPRLLRFAKVIADPELRALLGKLGQPDPRIEEVLAQSPLERPQGIEALRGTLRWLDRVLKERQSNIDHLQYDLKKGAEREQGALQDIDQRPIQLGLLVRRAFDIVFKLCVAAIMGTLVGLVTATIGCVAQMAKPAWEHGMEWGFFLGAIPTAVAMFWAQDHDRWEDSAQAQLWRLRQERGRAEQALADRESALERVRVQLAKEQEELAKLLQALGK